MISNRKRVAFHTLGCKLNYTETSMIWQSLEENGYTKVGFEEHADIYLINTCSVTENADKECRRIVRKVKNNNSDSLVLVTGCYAQLKPEEIAAIDGVNCVVGAKDKFRIADILDEVEKSGTDKAVIYSCDINDVETYHSSYSLGERTRAFLKVQDGCDYSCTYCTIPLARGRSRSDTVSNVVKQAEMLATKGIKEIVLSGVNIGDFGYSELQSDKRQETFYDLIRALDKVTGIARFRISSIEPNLLRDEIIEFVGQSERLAPHFHIPLQSGSDKILGLMKRRYKREIYTDRVSKIKSLLPHACIGVDVIVGFPGETDKDFMGTYNYLNELPISYLHVFTYSERDNTEAAGMKEVVPHQVRNERNKMLRILSEKKKNVFYNEHLSSKREVLWEIESDGDYMLGWTDNYVRVRAPYNPLLSNTLQTVVLGRMEGTEVLASSLTEV